MRFVHYKDSRVVDMTQVQAFYRDVQGEDEEIVFRHDVDSFTNWYFETAEEADQVFAMLRGSVSTTVLLPLRLEPVVSIDQQQP